MCACLPIRAFYSYRTLSACSVFAMLVISIVLSVYLSNYTSISLLLCICMLVHFFVYLNIYLSTISVRLFPLDRQYPFQSNRQCAPFLLLPNTLVISFALYVTASFFPHSLIVRLPTPYPPGLISNYPTLSVCLSLARPGYPRASLAQISPPLSPSSHQIPFEGITPLSKDCGGGRGWAYILTKNDQ